MMAAKVCPETEEQNKIRFQVELEFVQCLANPNYIHFLAQRGYLKEAPFVNYLAYLQYWKEPSYARYLKYPMCLHFLDLLQHEHFRREVVSAQVCKLMDEQALLVWQHYTRRRTRTLAPAQGAGAGLQTAPPAPSQPAQAAGMLGGAGAGGAAPAPPPLASSAPHASAAPPKHNAHPAL